MNSITDRFQEFADEQRVERLASCKALEKALKDCQRKRDKLLQKLKSEEKLANDKQISTPSSSQSFWNRWRKPRSENNNPLQVSNAIPNDGNKSQEQKNPPSKTTAVLNCHREAHALWACRAKALKCGSELVTLNKCFKTDPTDSCREEQEIVGKCVIKNSSELEERIRKRNEQL